MSSFYGKGVDRPPSADENPRCVKCNKLLAESLSRPWKIKCPRCKETNES